MTAAKAANVTQEVADNATQTTKEIAKTVNKTAEAVEVNSSTNKL